MTVEFERRSYRRAEDVARDLQQYIRQQRPDYAWGAPLPTLSALAAEFETSRRTMKVALEILVGDGWVTLSLHGPHVSEIPLEFAVSVVAPLSARRPRGEDVLEFLRAVEPQAAAQAALNAAKNALGRRALDAVRRRLEERWNNASPTAAMDDDRAVHIAIAGLCENNKFYSSIRDCYARIEAPLRGKAQPYTCFSGSISRDDVVTL